MPLMRQEVQKGKSIEKTTLLPGIAKNAQSMAQLIKPKGKLKSSMDNKAIETKSQPNFVADLSSVLDNIANKANDYLMA